MEFVQRLKSNKFLIVFCLIVFIFAFGIRIFYASQKAGFHIDESSSVIFANNSLNNIVFSPEERNYLGLGLKQKIYFANGSIKELFSDLNQLHITTGDSPHTNLYYVLLRLSLFGLDVPEFSEIVKRGIGLNLIFFTVSFILMYRILSFLFKNDFALIPLGLLIAFCNTASISSTLFLRPYQMQEMFFLLLTFVCLNFYQDIRKKQFFNKKNFIVALFTLTFVFLTGYLAPFYVFFLGMGLIIISIKEKEWKNLVLLFDSCFYAILFACVLYFDFLFGFFSYRATEAVSNVQVFDNLVSSIKGLGSNLIYFLCYLPTLFLLLFVYLRRVFLKSKFEKNEIIPFLIIISFMWILLVMFLVPFKVVRYIMPIFPVFSLVYVYALSGDLKKIERNIYIGCFSLIFVIFALFPQKMESYDVELPVHQKSFPYSAHLENLFLQASEYTEEFKNNKDVIFLLSDDLVFHHLYINLDNNQRCRSFNAKYEELPKLEEFYFVSANPNELLKNSGYGIEKQMNIGYSLYLVKAIKK